MKKNYLIIILLLINYFGNSQISTIAYTSFEDVDLTGVSGNYTDTGSNTTAHNMANNPLPEPPIDTPVGANEMGMDAKYVPYNSPSTGMTDGDIVGVSNLTSDVGSYTDGTQGYKFSDTDGTFELHSEVINISDYINVVFTIDYFINSTTYEGDGTHNSLTDDRMSIYVYNSNGDSQVILETAGSDINDLGIEGTWQSANINIDPTWNTFKVVITAQSNSNNETLYIDNLELKGVESFVSRDIIAHTSFEDIDLTGVSGNYIDTGSSTTAHNMVNNPLPEPPVDTPNGVSEMGMDARYVPYDNPSTGMTDGDIVGVSNLTSDVGNYTDGTQGYKFSDTDGTFELHSEFINISDYDDVIFTIDYFVNSTTYEGDGTNNNLTDDRMSIIAYNDVGDSQIILETAGSDINSLAIEGRWLSAKINIDPTWNTFNVVIREQSNSNSETLYIDNLKLEGHSTLSSENVNLVNFKYYPNPINNTLNIISQDKIDKIIIYNVLGQEVYVNSKTLKNNKIDMSNLSKGTYIVKVRINNDTNSFKVIKL